MFSLLGDSRFFPLTLLTVCLFFRYFHWPARENGETRTGKTDKQERERVGRRRRESGKRAEKEERRGEGGTGKGRNRENGKSNFVPILPFSLILLSVSLTDSLRFPSTELSHPIERAQARNLTCGKPSTRNIITVSKKQEQVSVHRGVL